MCLDAWEPLSMRMWKRGQGMPGGKIFMGEDRSQRPGLGIQGLKCQPEIWHLLRTLGSHGGFKWGSEWLGWAFVGPSWLPLCGCVTRGRWRRGVDFHSEDSPLLLFLGVWLLAMPCSGFPPGTALTPLATLLFWLCPFLLLLLLFLQ